MERPGLSVRVQYCIVCGFPSRRLRSPRHHDRPGWRVSEKAARERRQNNASSQVRKSGGQRPSRFHHGLPETEIEWPPPESLALVTARLVWLPHAPLSSVGFLAAKPGTPAQFLIEKEKRKMSYYRFPGPVGPVGPPHHIHQTRSRLACLAAPSPSCRCH